jgi:hypothetical protein
MSVQDGERAVSLGMMRASVESEVLEARSLHRGWLRPRGVQRHLETTGGG